MEWEGGLEAGEIEDRRGPGPVAEIAGLGAGGMVLALIGFLVFGINPATATMSALTGVGGPVVQQQAKAVRGSPTGESGRFVDEIATSVDDVWTQVFRQQGRRYQPPAAVVLYDQSTGTGCGLGQSVMGPFYCPNDQKVYLDLSAWQELSDRFGAPGAAAKAYVIAHEMGHHVQNLLGETREAERMGVGGAGSGSLRLELQADCYAGVWAAHASEVSGGKISLDSKDIEDGLRAAAVVGDDTLQKASQGQVVSDSLTHGASAQRLRWFRAGASTGDPAVCDTLRAPSL